MWSATPPRDRRPLRCVRAGRRVGRAARDRVALVLRGVVDLLAVDLDAAVRVVAQARGAELGLGALLVGGLALAPAEGHVLGVVVGPVLEVLGRGLLELLDLLLAALVCVLDLCRLLSSL